MTPVYRPLSDDKEGRRDNTFHYRRPDGLIDSAATVEPPIVDQYFTPYTPTRNSGGAPPVLPSETRDVFMEDDPLWSEDGLDQDNVDEDA